ncbi:MAG: hypothetical protein M3O30_11975 [Planctomycetota bacterium]|nr:hypothetical protein [Planctomycetota bacterium]
MRLVKTAKTATIILSSSLLCAGCGPGLIANGPWPDKDNKLPSEGLAYYLPVDKIAVNATVTIKDQLTVDEKLKLTTTHEQTSTATIAVTTVADSTKYFMLNIAPNGSKDQTLDIAVGPDGLLTSVNYLGTDRISETVSSIAKATADVAGTFVGASLKAAAVDPDLVKTAFELTKLGIKDKANISTSQPSTQQQYDEDFASFKATPPLTIYFLAYSAGGMSLWDKRSNLDAKLTQLIQNRIDTLSAAAKAAKDQIDVFNSQATALSNAVAIVQDQRDKMQTQFQAALDQFVADKHLGPAAANVVTVNSVLQISDLANENDAKEVLDDVPRLVKRLSHSENTSIASFSLEKNKPAWKLLQNTGVFLTIKPDNAASSVARDAPVPVNTNTARLAYRQAVPYVLTTYSLKISPNENLAKSQLTQTDQKIIPLISPDAPTLFIAYDSKAFSDQKLALTFAQGRLTGVSQGATASAAKAAAGIASAIDTGLTTYGSALTQEQNNQKTEQAILANQLASQLATLQSQKSILDAQIANQGEHVDAKLLLQKQEFDQQLATLQSQVATQSEALNAPLLVQQSNANQQVATLQAQQAVTNYQATAQIIAQQAIVKSQVDLLTQKVSLLTQQVAEMNQQAALKKAAGQ